MTAFLYGKRAHAPDLPQLQRLPVLRAVTVLQSALLVRHKVVDGHLLCPAFVIFTQAFSLGFRLLLILQPVLPRCDAGQVPELLCVIALTGKAADLGHLGNGTVGFCQPAEAFMEAVLPEIHKKCLSGGPFEIPAALAPTQTDVRGDLI